MLPSRKTCYHNACGLDRQLELGYAGTLVVQSRFRRLVSVCVAMDHRAAAMLITSQDGHYNQSPAFQSTVARTAMSRVRRGAVKTFTHGSMRGLWAAAAAVSTS